MWEVVIKRKVAKELKIRALIPIDIESALLTLVAELKLGPHVKWPITANSRTRVTIGIADIAILKKADPLG